MAASNEEMEAIIQGHEARNSALRQVFVDKGADLGEPRTIECHFWTSSEKDSVGLAEDLTRLGFVILAQRASATSRDPTLWNVEAAIKQSIELTMRREFTEELVRVAVHHSGKYDGWGTLL